MYDTKQVVNKKIKLNAGPRLANYDGYLKLYQNIGYT